MVQKRKAEQSIDNVDYDKRKRSALNHSQAVDSTNDYQNDDLENNLSQVQDLKRSKSNKHNAGTIERVYVKNFKCHPELEFDLGTNINFILGRNGSGKSAVMDAIILCFGGNAKSTGRQANAKTFIKKNCDKAEISITIRNQGDEAYKPYIYGDRITIERKLSADSASSYKIYSKDRKSKKKFKKKSEQNNYFALCIRKDKLQSTKKLEIDYISQHFNIQVDNPICFLNQETSKHFLNSSNKSDCYKV